MPKKRYNAEEIIHELREADVLLGQANTVSQVCRYRGEHPLFKDGCDSVHDVNLLRRFQATPLSYFVHFIVLSGFLDHLNAYTVTGLSKVYLLMLDLH